MEMFVIRGGVPLCGETEIQGAKNSALPILAAALLTRGACVLHGCPRLTDVDASCAILRHLGAKAEREGGNVIVEATAPCCVEIPNVLMQAMRSSVLFLGPMLARMGQAEISLPGGCELGPRPVDLHLEALRALGAQISVDGSRIRCRGTLHGGSIRLRYPSVGATENAVMAACLAQGTTTIEGAACEPEICDLADFLRTLGAHIAGDGSPRITIEGVEALHGGSHWVMPDRIVTATWLSAAAAAGGEIALRGAVAEHLRPVIAVFERAGARVESEPRLIRMQAGALTAPGRIETAPYPGFPTDAQAPVMAALLRAAGRTTMRETVFSSRFSHVPELRKLGAQIETDGDTAVVTGVTALHGAQLHAEDLRGEAAAIVGALGAAGQSAVTGLDHIDRGYEDAVRDLSRLGACIERVELPDEMVYTT